MSEAQDWNKKIIDEFRANGGKVGGYFKNTSLLILHTTGARSGLPRVNPTAYIEDGDRLVIVASKAGADSHPDWYHNLVANPQVTVEVGTEEFSALASVTKEPERSELFARVAAKYPNFADYERKTTRVIPVITLTRITG
jgi:deazaflavin-dependent oxidoreductase (nitroreductase family)